MHSTSRYYFHAELDGQMEQLSNHSLNGSIFEGSGAYVIRNGQMMRNARHEVTITVGTGRFEKSRKITAEDFGGNAVLVKLWRPENMGTEWFWLIPVESGDVLACDYSGSFNALKQVPFKG